LPEQEAFLRQQYWIVSAAQWILQSGTEIYYKFVYFLCFQAATLLFGTGESTIHRLFSRGTHLQFGYGALILTLACYFMLACWAAGSAISSGLVVPMLVIGGLLGRIVGKNGECFTFELA